MTEKESKIQRNILAWLHDNGFWAFKVVTANVRGIPDIVGCTPQGLFFAIEVKAGNNVLSVLQAYKLKEIQGKNGIAFSAYSVEEVKAILGKHSIAL